MLCHLARRPSEYCHQLALGSAALGRACFNCHRGDDAHEGSFGTNCERCHVVENWKRIKTRLSGLGDMHDDGSGVRLSGSSDAPTRIDRVGVVLGDASQFARRPSLPHVEQ